MKTKQKIFLKIGIKFAVITLAMIIPAIWYFFDHDIAYGQEENQTVDRSYLRCYASFSTKFMLANMLTPDSYSIDLTDPDIKQFITNGCNFIHEKTGIWPLVTDDDYGLGSNEFLPRYYPNGLPESVEKLISIARELSELK